MPNPLDTAETRERLEAMAAGRGRDDEAVAAALLRIMRRLRDIERKVGA